MAAMHNTTERATLSPIMMLAPAALLLIGYHYFFHAKSQSRLANVRTQEAKLVTETQSIDSDTAAQLTRVRQIKSEREKVDRDIKQQEQEEQRLVKQRGELQREFFVASRPAETMQSVVSLIESHDVIVLDNEMVSRAGETLTEKERGEIARLLLHTQAAGDSDHTHRLILEGTFKDIRSAVHAIKDEIPTVAINSLALQAADPRTDLRIWVLTLSH